MLGRNTKSSRKPNYGGSRRGRPGRRGGQGNTGKIIAMVGVPVLVLGASAIAMNTYGANG